MLVGVREYRREEVRHICGLPADAALVSHYSLLRNKNEITVADVTDTRARKTVNCDHYTMTARELFAEAVGPIARAVLPPVLFPQVVVVVDGTDMTRLHTLLDPEEGLLVQLWHLMVETTEFKNLLEVVYVAAVELGDKNSLRDIAAATTPSRESIIVEDTDDHFTSLEDASYMELRDKEDLMALLKRVRNDASHGLHQIFSFILSYREETRLQNSTIQFVSLAVSEVTRGMRSTRHCVTTAASLIESRSPSIAFSGTKISHLLKPVLLGQQPGLWISCFAPASPLIEHQRETFKDAFSIAYTLSRVYGTRVAVGVSDAFQLLGGPICRQLFDKSREYDEIQPCTDVPKPSAFNVSEGAKRGSEENVLPSSHLLSSSALSPLATALFTKTEKPPSEELGCGIDAVTDNLAGDVPAASFLAASASANAADTTATTTAPAPLVAPRDVPGDPLVNSCGRRKGPLGGRNTAPKSCTDEKSSGQSTLRHSAHHRCSSMEKHPYYCSARYEFETYRRVMEPAMEQLRRDLKHYATQLEDARHQVRGARRQKDAEREVRQLQASLWDSERHCQLLLEDHARREGELQAKVTELQTLCDNLSRELRVRMMPSLSQSREVRQESVATQTSNSLCFSFQSCQPHEKEDDFVTPVMLQKETESKVRHMEKASQWLEVVNYHQRELEDCANRERSYRERIVLLEKALHKSEATTAELKEELTQREQAFSLEAMNRQHRENEVEIEKSFSGELERLRAEVFETQKSNMKVEQRLEACLGELQQERRERKAIEAELRQLQATWDHNRENGTAKETLRFLKGNSEHPCSQLQREAEELRQRTQSAASREGTPSRGGSAISTSTHKTVERKPTGMMSPAVDRETNSTFSSEQRSSHIEYPVISGTPPVRRGFVPLKPEAARFEEFMKGESSYTFHLPKALERMRS